MESMEGLVVKRKVGGALEIEIYGGTILHWTNPLFQIGDVVVVAYDWTREKIRDVWKKGEPPQDNLQPHVIEEHSLVSDNLDLLDHSDDEYPIPDMSLAPYGARDEGT